MSLDPIYFATAVEAALEAGRVQRQFFRQHLVIEKKGPVDLVTAADRAVERGFAALIADRFPDHGILGEEAGVVSATARCRWIIDPIDGTTNFAHGLALFCVSIAFEVDGIVEIGVVYDAMAEELFTAERGQGARLNGAPLRVSNTASLGDAVLCTGFPYKSQDGRARQVQLFAAFLRTSRAVRRLGSAALDLSYVAAGRLDGFWEEDLHAWDIAAGMLIASEAGARVTNFAEGPVSLDVGQIVASNGRVHQEMLHVIATS
jgi:myo-inositol-1(or 4)-monophosphatase